jgi:hypothetical protein
VFIAPTLAYVTGALAAAFYPAYAIDSFVLTTGIAFAAEGLVWTLDDQGHSGG